MLHLTSISNIGEGRRFSKTVLPATEIRFQSRVEKSKRGTECQKVDGIPPCAKATGLPACHM
ncbi:MAG: hypothetical protein PHF18_11730 [Methanosarcina sp.]|nr:hypothetical protein [Methanosarcina sp.]MDD3247501.1 hypothetical protein [Methanosarcina sp.]MDD4248638.1 hypothetical protein [Methanosarcina sp.]MDD4249151.1 hypothetical protein [Methanosarcina sp.]